MKSTYPIARVVWLYALFGGVIGGVLVGLGDTIINEHSSFLSTIKITTIVGFFFGLIPALVTGWILAYGQLYRNKSSFLMSFWTGTIISLVYALFVLMLVRDLGGGIGSGLFLVSIGLTGGMSAVLTGLFALPKKETFIEQDI